MKVSILDDFTESNIEHFIDKMYVAARNCYSEKDCTELLANAYDKTLDQKIKLISKVLDSGHFSIAEHVSITFSVDGISRACSHQLVRHRLCTYSQKSQRYCSYEGKMFEYITPKTIKESKYKAEYDQLMENIQNIYDKLVEVGIKPEDARYILPNAACTNIVVTTNLRNIIHVMGLRCCSRAQWEVRQMFKQLAEKLKAQLPFMSKYFGPNCQQLGYCPEGDKSCGLFPVLNETISK